mmetsp:Transcript_30133/g.71760  ORF Transcript_30133/g.71760 Transcript_30133/m.71760 type:complete len:225 (+) Transcript_30133:745-1419(+)
MGLPLESPLLPPAGAIPGCLRGPALEASCCRSCVVGRVPNPSCSRWAVRSSCVVGRDSLPIPRPLTAKAAALCPAPGAAARNRSEAEADGRPSASPPLREGGSCRGARGCPGAAALAASVAADGAGVRGGSVGASCEGIPGYPAGWFSDRLLLSEGGAAAARASAGYLPPLARGGCWLFAPSDVRRSVAGAALGRAPRAAGLKPAGWEDGRAAGLPPALRPLGP